jgi:glutaredoxin
VGAWAIVVAVVGALMGGAGWLAVAKQGVGASAPRAPTQQELYAEARRVHVVIYSASWCPSCDHIKTFLWKNGIPYEEHDIDKERGAREQAFALNPAHTIPVIDVEGAVFVGANEEPVIKGLLAAAEKHLASQRP